jgi:hypothetical protein
MRTETVDTFDRGLATISAFCEGSGWGRHWIALILIDGQPLEHFKNYSGFNSEDEAIDAAILHVQRGPECKGGW